MWEQAFGSSFKDGFGRVKVLLRRFGVMDRFERAGPGGKAVFDATRTVISDSDFAMVAVLAMVGAAALGEEIPQVVRLLGGPVPESEPKATLPGPGVQDPPCGS